MASLPKFSGVVKELRFIFSPVASSSSGIREFLAKNYVGLRNINPGTKFMLREGNSVSPRVYARYPFGKESFAAVDNASSDEIMDKIRKLGTA